MITALQNLWTTVWPTSCAGAADRRRIDEIRARADSLRTISDAQLAEAAERLRAENDSTPEACEPLVSGFAVAYEALRRVHGIQLYDVQLLGGLALARGDIAELQTGEGKTFTAAAPVFAWSRSGLGVHVATPNAYLARRDHELLRPVYELLRTNCRLLPEGNATEAKRAAYAADITYGTGYEFGFDFLRDRLSELKAGKTPLSERLLRSIRGESPTVSRMQRGHAAAVIDEIDSVLLDEASLPLILAEAAAAAAGVADPYQAAVDLAWQLRSPEDYVLQSRERRLQLTPQGAQRAMSALPPQQVTALGRPWLTYVEQALYANLVLRRDIDYVVQGNEVLLVDQSTGRIFADRKLRDGLHQAVEVKEGLIPSAEQDVAARISRQRYFRLYQRICGMTGTARGSESEFRELYGLTVTCIAPRNPTRREIWPDRYFRCDEAKYAAAASEVCRLQQIGRPVLVGSRTVENSLRFAALLRTRGLTPRLLNGLQDENEAQVVAAAGQLGTVTVATNMAGRGTDIPLGPGVRELGGLHLLSIERNESQRDDRQLIGRVARQGDPGSCQFFVSADDAVLRRFGPDLAARMKQLPHDNQEIREDLRQAVEAVQQRAEALARRRRREVTDLDARVEALLGRLA